MTRTRFKLTPNPEPDESSPSPTKRAITTTTNTSAMRIIVPLQGVVQGRGGLVLGSVIPCALFYFLQLYLRRNRSNSTSPSSPSSPTHLSPSNSSNHLTRSQSRLLLSPRGVSATPAFLSARANSVAKPDDSPYYVGLDRVAQDPYDTVRNPDGVIQLGLAENKLSLDLIQDWVSENSRNCAGEGSGELSISGIATYQPFHGLAELKVCFRRQWQDSCLKSRSGQFLSIHPRWFSRPVQHRQLRFSAFAWQTPETHFSFLHPIILVLTGM